MRLQPPRDSSNHTPPATSRLLASSTSTVRIAPSVPVPLSHSIGCKDCANICPNLLRIEDDFGRAQLHCQSGNPNLIQEAIESCIFQYCLVMDDEITSTVRCTFIAFSLDAEATSLLHLLHRLSTFTLLIYPCNRRNPRTTYAFFLLQFSMTGSPRSRRRFLTRMRLLKFPLGLMHLVLLLVIQSLTLMKREIRMEYGRAHVKYNLTNNFSCNINSKMTNELRTHIYIAHSGLVTRVGKDYQSRFHFGNDGSCGANYIQSVTPNLSLGTDVLWLRDQNLLLVSFELAGIRVY